MRPNDDITMTKNAEASAESYGFRVQVIGAVLVDVVFQAVPVLCPPSIGKPCIEVFFKADKASNFKAGGKIATQDLRESGMDKH